MTKPVSPLLMPSDDDHCKGLIAPAPVVVDWHEPLDLDGPRAHRHPVPSRPGFLGIGSQSRRETVAHGAGIALGSYPRRENGA